MKRIAYYTLGCKVNQCETEQIRAELERCGFTTVPFSSSADIYIINTCSVTSTADSKSRVSIRRAIRQNPDALVVVTGCFADLEPGKVLEIEGVDLVVPNAEKEKIAEILISTFSENLLSSFSKPEFLYSKTENNMRIRPRTRTRAVVKVQDGCDQFCSYCIVPFARPSKKSRPIPEVLEELKNLADFGYKEIVLSGIRLGSYDFGLPELILKAAEVNGIERIRLSSIEPWEVGDELLNAMKNPKVCRHLHIPLQSGDDNILMQMNRPYDSAQYLDIISKVRDKLPGVGITTDVIVGFPGEDDKAFNNTCNIIKEIDFSRLHVFRYSPRQRTKACKMSGQVDPKTKKERSEKLIALGTVAKSRFASSFIGRKLNVLVETQDKESKKLRGFADNYVEVSLSGDNSLKGKIVPVKITNVNGDGGAEGIVINSSI